MLRNLDLTCGALFSQRVLLALVHAGMRRDDAYRIVQDAPNEHGTPGRRYATCSSNRTTGSTSTRSSTWGIRPARSRDRRPLVVPAWRAPTLSPQRTRLVHAAVGGRLEPRVLPPCNRALVVGDDSEVDEAARLENLAKVHLVVRPLMCLTASPGISKQQILDRSTDRRLQHRSSCLAHDRGRKKRYEHLVVVHPLLA